jgi:aryl-alcohol dehydrogenase-like predicted oxidoreductase
VRYRNLGRTGLKVSTISLGAWTTYGKSIEDKKLIQNILEKALENGINFFDNADIYAKGQAERYLGEVFKVIGPPRHHLVRPLAQIAVRGLDGEWTPQKQGVGSG